MVRFLTLTKDWAEHNGVEVKFIQLGDCYELWESELIPEKLIKDEQFNIYQYNQMLHEGDIRFLLTEIEGCKERIEQYKNTRESFKDSDYLMKEIKKKYKKLFGCGVNMKILQGNHDNKLNNPKKDDEQGIDNCILMEHGHAVDPYNNDENWNRGYGVVRRLVIPTEHISKPVRLGDIVKKTEPYLDAIKSSFLGTKTRKEMFINYAFSQARDNNKRVFVMGHTHHPKLIKKNLRQVNESLKEKKPPDMPIGLMKF